MRVLLAGDVHGNLGHLRDLYDRAAAEGAATILQLGDFGYWEHTPSGTGFLDDANRSARSRGVSVYFVDGNHDRSGLIHDKYADRRDEEGFLVVRPRIRYAPRGHLWTWAGTTFLAFGGARSLDREWRLREEQAQYDKAVRRERYRREAGRPPREVPSTEGTLWFPEEEATDADTEAILAAVAGTRVDVLLTHDKPRATDPEGNRKDLPECHPNQDRIQRLVDTLRPALLAHGHLHRRSTGEIAHPDGSLTRVEALAADPAASWDIPGYRAADSWMVLDTALLRDSAGGARRR